MNILMLHPHDLFSPKEPWTVRIKNIACQFVKKGHSVKLVYFPLDKNAANKEFVDNGIEYIPLDRSLGVFILFRNIVCITKLAEWADIIHFQKCYYYTVLPALIAALVKNKPLHYDWDDWETKIFYYSNPKQKFVGEFLNIFEQLIPEAVDTVSVSSNHLRNLVLFGGVSNDRIFMAPVGADLEEFNTDVMERYRGNIRTRYNIKERHLVIYIGQLHGGQYVELFIQAGSLVLRNTNDVRFMVVGDGYRAPELKQLSKNLGIEKQFIFTGHVEHKRIPYYLSDADVCVACFEDNDITKCKSPLKIVEYLSCGKAIVASNVGEVRNMVGGVGVLVKPGDAAELANGINLLISDHSLRDRLSKVSMERARRKYNWKSTADSILAAYDVAIHNRRFL